MKQSTAGRAPVPSSLNTLTAVWIVVFTLVLRVVGFAWTTSLIAGLAFGALHVLSFFAVRGYLGRRSSTGPDGSPR